MFPLRDTVQARSLPLMNWALIAVNVLIFVLLLSGPRAELWITRYGMVPAQIFSTPTAWLTVVTSMFLHGGLFHLISNMWALYIFGDNVEDRMGPTRFLFFYLLCGAAAAVVHILMNPNSTIPTVGASGAISGVMGAYLVLFPYSRVITLIPFFFFPYFFRGSCAFLYRSLVWRTAGECTVDFGAGAARYRRCGVVGARWRLRCGHRAGAPVCRAAICTPQLHR